MPVLHNHKITKDNLYSRIFLMQPERRELLKTIVAKCKDTTEIVAAQCEIVVPAWRDVRIAIAEKEHSKKVEEESMSEIFGIFINPLLNSLVSMAGVFLSIAKILLAVFITIAAVLAARDWWTSGSLEDVLKTRGRMIITSTVVLSLFANWPGLTKTFAGFFHKVFFVLLT
jgi:hypothetical protein